MQMGYIIIFNIMRVAAGNTYTPHNAKQVIIPIKL